MFTTPKDIIDLLKPQSGGIILMFGDASKTTFALQLLRTLNHKNESGVYISLGPPPAPQQLKGHLHAYAATPQKALSTAGR